MNAQVCPQADDGAAHRDNAVTPEQNFAAQKNEFLTAMRGGGKAKYRRYTGMPIRYAGGKSLAVGHVIEHLPCVKKVVSPFFGGGSVELALAKDLGLEVIGYDIFDVLASYWRVQLREPKKLAARILRWSPDKKTFKAVKDVLKKHWNGEALIADELELAAHYWFNHNLSYGPAFLAWMSSLYLEPHRFQIAVERVRDFDVTANGGRMTVSAGAFEQTIPMHREDFLYCDPPYYLDGDSKMFRGIYPQRNFPIHHNNFNHRLLAEQLAEHKGGFILSYNDCATVREWYRDYRIVEVAWQYTLGLGETRVGTHRLEAGATNSAKQSHEILIIKHPTEK